MYDILVRTLLAFLITLLALPVSAQLQDRDGPPPQIGIDVSPTPVTEDLADSRFPGNVELASRFLLPRSGTDLDRDGLVDAGEDELADAFRPYLIFDSREKHRRSFEPVTLYQVRPRGCAGPVARCGGPLEVSIVYLFLWQWDGGYGGKSWCGDTHLGDNQKLSIIVESVDSGKTFRIKTIHNGRYLWPRKSGAVGFHSGRHPRIYFSQGKHHQFFDTRMDGRDSPYSSWGCNETIDGGGASLLSTVSGNNVGEPEAHASFIGPLDNYGFTGEDAWDENPFCGGLACPSSKGASPNASKWSDHPFTLPR